uniref:Uncharacterized protein n=1 Tax=Oryza glumipatula TaxID=40148 RepID=A0A0D9ZK58_9ORYZ
MCPVRRTVFPFITSTEVGVSLVPKKTRSSSELDDNEPEVSTPELFRGQVQKLMLECKMAILPIQVLSEPLRFSSLKAIR